MERSIIILGSIILILSLTTCEKPERDNPFDEKGILSYGDWAPVNLAVDQVSITQRKLTWEYGDRNIEGFRVDRKEGSGNWHEGYASLAKDVRTWTDDQVKPAPGLAYTYRLYAYAGKNTSGKIEGSFVSGFPSPSGLQIDQVSDFGYRLIWQYEDTGHEGFRIDRKAGEDEWEIGFGQTGAEQLIYTDENVFSEKTSLNVQYRVYAYHGDHQSEKIQSNVIATIDAPAGLSCTVHTLTSLSLQWTFGQSGHQGFWIDRKRGDSEWETRIADLPADARKYQDDTVDLVQNGYTYRVFAYVGHYRSSGADLYVALPQVTTQQVSAIGENTATGGGHVTDQGSSEVTERGIVYSTSQNPTTSNSKVTAGSGTGAFTANMTGLQPNTTYYVRAYATNSAGTGYGNQIKFTTQDASPVANFTATPTSGTAPLTVQFTDQSTNNPTSWLWNFGVGRVSHEQNPTHVFEHPGNYNVILLVENSYGSDGKVELNYIAVEGSDSGDGPRDTETQVVEVTNPATGRTWMDRNLGASRAATSSTDAQAYGDLYQWGRAADGHQKRNSGTASTLSSSDTPGHGNFILSPNSPWDWRSPQNDNLWQGVNGVNNPCPPGYRLPTDAELNAECLSWSSNNRAGAFASPLKLPVAGSRVYGSGSLDDVGSYGLYWSSTVGGSYSRILYFHSGYADVISSARAYGFSVRCLKD